MTALAHLLTVAALMLQSCGAVLFGTVLAQVHASHYVVSSLMLTMVVCLALAGGRLPPRGRGWLAISNGLMAISYVGFFYALRHLPAGIVGALEVGVAVLTAIVAAAQRQGRLPRGRRLTAAGIAIGCLLLAGSAAVELLARASPWPGGLALLACVASGICSAAAIAVAKRMQALGWCPPTIVAHRLYLALLLALAWAWVEAPPATMTASLHWLLAMGALCVLLPQLLLQHAVRHAEAGRVQVWSGLQPAMAYGLSQLTPGFRWHTPTFVAVSLVTVAVLADMRIQAAEDQTGAVGDLAARA